MQWSAVLRLEYCLQSNMVYVFRDIDGCRIHLITNKQNNCTTGLLFMTAPKDVSSPSSVSNGCQLRRTSALSMISDRTWRLVKGDIH
jgi:hypothetical protein